MRIVAGAHRGRTLVAPKGHSTRPTADRVRQALFDVLEHAAWAPRLGGARVLDLFAGSGALGLEALSRGAATCVFVDDNRAAIDAVRTNVAALRIGAAARIVQAEALRFAAGAREPFDLVFLDPPYGKGLEARALTEVFGWEAVVVLETNARDAIARFGRWQTLDDRVWGAARVRFLKRKPEEARSEAGEQRRSPSSC